MRRLTDPDNAVRAGKRKASSARLSSEDESVPWDQSHRNGGSDAVDIPMDTDTDGLGVADMTDHDDDGGSESNQMSAVVLGDIDRAVSTDYYLSLAVSDIQ